MGIESEGPGTGKGIAATIIELEAQAAEEQGMTSATFCQMGTEQLRFPPGYFDAMACSLALLQIRYTRRALSEGGGVY